MAALYGCALCGKDDMEEMIDTKYAHHLEKFGRQVKGEDFCVNDDFCAKYNDPLPEGFP